MAFVSIETQSLLAALDKLSQLNCTLGKNARIGTDNKTLMVSMAYIDKLLEEDLNTPPESTPPEPSPPTERIVHALDLGSNGDRLKQIQSKFTDDWRLATDDGERAEVYAAYKRRQRMLRDDIVLGWIAAEYRATTLIYANLPQVFPRGAEVLTFPDGKARQVISLIHFSHPNTPEELYLRERRIQAERIIHYRVPGLDCTEYERSEMGRSPITPSVLRKILSQ